MRGRAAQSFRKISDKKQSSNDDANLFVTLWSEFQIFNVMDTKITLLIGLLAFGCSSDDTFDNSNPMAQPQNTERPGANNIKNNVPASQNKVLLLKVDYLTHAFEGGKELIYPNNPNFNLTYDYQSAGDFGGMTLMYADVGQPIFSGTIIWMGLGVMQYPQSLLPVSAFATTGNLPMPGANDFVVIDAEQNMSYYQDPVPFSPIWDAVKNLQLVHQYRSINPNAPVRLFVYTPSVGVGDPADWDYFVMIKN
jgi:hypothetical protein